MSKILSMIRSSLRKSGMQQEQRLINQGDIYWLWENPDELEATIPHPYVVIQEDVLNHSRIHTVVVCALTSNLQRANRHGNVLLEAGEGNLPKQSVIEVSKVASIEKSLLRDYIGTVSKERVHQILAGLRFLQRSFFTD